jgi:hypothetical protein
MTSKLPRQNDLDRTRLYLVDTVPLPDGSAVYPAAPAYNAAVDALTMRVRFVDVGVTRAEPKSIREIISSIRPDEILWVSNRREAPFEADTLTYMPYGATEPVFPVLDRWHAEHYLIKHAPGARPWQLQIHCLPLGPEWFSEYVRDLSWRFPAFTNAVVFGLERCAYQDDAIESIRLLRLPWSCAAAERLLSRPHDLKLAGCLGVMVDGDEVDVELVCRIKLLGLRVHGMGTDGARSLTIPYDAFQLIRK